MATQGGFGLKFKVSITSVLTLTTKVIECDFPSQEREVADVTAHDATSGYAEWIGTGRRSLSEFTATLLWDKLAATHAAILTAFSASTSLNMSIEDPSGAEIITFNGWVKSIKRMSEQDDGFKAEVVVQPTGVPTITP